MIWMDMRMGVMDGDEATRRIRELPGGREVKIAALTASAFREDNEEIVAAGCDEVLLKPLDEDRLFAAMERLLGVRFRYENKSADPAAAKGSAGIDLCRLPAPRCDELRCAAELLDMEATGRAIGHIREVDSDLAKALEDLARGYRYDGIVSLCDAR